ncbi:MAG: four helix bundle protein [Candidatus Berkelbacteria bacterium]|nr:four helix bundle protein [Candidatus Berkelbacteria bacterium]
MTWKQANEIFELTEKFVKTLPKYHPETGQKMMDTADHMLRSARSGVRNIEEGFSRASTKEYIEFLGFSKGSLEELLGDFEYCRRNNLGDVSIADRAIFLLKGEGKMLHNQMEALEQKRVGSGNISSNEKIVRRQQNEERNEKEFWREAEKFLGKGN